MSVDELRELASQWHGGQFSPLYAFASSGTVVAGAANEARICLGFVRATRMGDRLEELITHLEANEPEPEEEE